MSESVSAKANSRLLLGKLNRFSVGIRRLFEQAVLPRSEMFEAFPGEFADPREKQTYPLWKVQRSFRNLNLPRRRRSKQRRIYVLPIGPFPEVLWRAVNGLEISTFDLITTFLGIFFSGMTVTVMAEVPITEVSCGKRYHPVTGKLQLLVTDVLQYLTTCLPADGFCIVGVTWVDLYPGEEWNFVLGQSSCLDGCAAVSFGHFEPQSFNNSENSSLSKDGNNVSPKRGNSEIMLCGKEKQGVLKHDAENFVNLTEVDEKVIWRLLRVTSHEICHVFGMAHCSYFACAMNESKSIVEAENQPLFLCPVCLRKLEKALGFDIMARYKALQSFLISIHDKASNDNNGECPCVIQSETLYNCKCKLKMSCLWLESAITFIENKGPL